MSVHCSAQRVEKTTRCVCGDEASCIGSASLKKRCCCGWRSETRDSLESPGVRSVTANQSVWSALGEALSLGVVGLDELAEGERGVVEEMHIVMCFKCPWMRVSSLSSLMRMEVSR